MATDNENEKQCPARHSRIVGCMLGGAVGDALGVPVALLTIDEIHRRHGRSGVARFEAAYGRKGAISDVTRMGMFTAEGLILSRMRQDDAQGVMVIPAIYHAYLRWLYTQDTHRQGQLVNAHGTCAVIDGVLTGHQAFFSQRSPGRMCLSSLRSGKMGTMDQPINLSKGCGGLMRVAPVGLAFPDAEEAFRLGCASAAITHGHPTGYLCAGFLAALISRLVCKQPLMAAISDTTRNLRTYKGHGECLKAVEGAVERSHSHNCSPAVIETLGVGRVAEEALAIGLYCALAAGNVFKQGVLSAVNHSGNSNSTGAITGNLLGALLGMDAIPGQWLIDLEMKDLVDEVAADICDLFIEKVP